MQGLTACLIRAVLEGIPKRHRKPLLLNHRATVAPCVVSGTQGAQDKTHEIYLSAGSGVTGAALMPKAHNLARHTYLCTPSLGMWEDVGAAKEYCSVQCL